MSSPSLQRQIAIWKIPQKEFSDYLKMKRNKDIQIRSVTLETDIFISNRTLPDLPCKLSSHSENPKSPKAESKLKQTNKKIQSLSSKTIINVKQIKTSEEPEIKGLAGEPANPALRRA